MILVTGGTGMLGRDVVVALAAAGIDAHLADRSKFDLTDPRGVYHYVAGPAGVIHLAAETNVDLCERDPRQAGIANHLATQAIAVAAQEAGAYLIYISTSNVFGAEGRFSYNELDLPASLNYCGKSKLMGENAVRAVLPSRSLIIRPGWMIGGGPEHDHKFVGRIIGQIRSGAEAISAVSDKYGSITYAKRLAEFIVWAVQTQHTGLVHFASMGAVSRLQIAESIGLFFGFPGTVKGVSSSEYPL
ncbi:SDR family oxidoreductase [uncultured Devosia sp.]|uniref:SDR family oxidoreductase n=1 Tax=uncultured Devosia sp. TaxID=211434 RepID=UPI0035C9EE1B